MRCPVSLLTYYQGFCRRPRTLIKLFLLVVLVFLIVNFHPKSLLVCIPSWSKIKLYHSTPVINYTIPHTCRHHNLSQAAVITRLHQTWKTHRLPQQFDNYVSTWRRCFPAWEYTLRDDVENRDFIKTHFSWFLQAYDSFEVNIQRVDAVRYFLMYCYGGIYTDLDTECLRPFEHLLSGYSLVFGAMEGNCGYDWDWECVQNSFFYSRPGHPFWMDLIKYMFLEERRKEENVEWTTGPIMMMRAMNNELPKYNPREWIIYPPNYFNPFSWTNGTHEQPAECKDLNRMTNEEYLVCREYFRQRPNTFVVQYHTQTWRFGKIL